jgi:PPOX class probable FMN-dependent enzyme
MTTTAADKKYDNRFNQEFGLPIDRVANKIADYLPEPIRQFIQESPFMVMATSDPDGRCDASPKGGKPGFVLILDDQHLLVPDVAGNRLFQSYQNMDTNPHVGLIFFIPGLGNVVRVNGRVSIVNRAEVETQGAGGSMYNPDGWRDVQQGIVVEIEEAYLHCPRAINYSKLWDTDNIKARTESGKNPLTP